MKIQNLCRGEINQCGWKDSTEMILSTNQTILVHLNELSPVKAREVAARTIKLVRVFGETWAVSSTFRA